MDKNLLLVLLVLACVILIAIFLVPIYLVSQTKPYQDFYTSELRGGIYTPNVTFTGFAASMLGCAVTSVSNCTPSDTSCNYVVSNPCGNNHSIEIVIAALVNLTKAQRLAQAQFNSTSIAIKGVSAPYLSSVYSSFLQISLAVASTLIGLYALLFVDIIKSLQDRDSKVSKGVKNLLIFLAIIPFPILLSCTYNIYVSFQIYQHLQISTNLFTSVMNQTAPNRIKLFFLTSSSAPQNITIPTNQLINPVNASILLGNDITKFPSTILNTNISAYLVLGLIFIIMNIILYTIFITKSTRK